MLYVDEMRGQQRKMRAADTVIDVDKVRDESFEPKLDV